MKGTVKWFGRDKGKGYIIGQDGTEYYFNVKGVQGSALPQSGDDVEFEPRAGKFGPVGHNVVIVRSARDAQTAAREAERNKSSVVCPKCGKRMVPRLVFSQGTVSHSVCPFSASTYKNHSGCVTAVLVVASTTLLLGNGLLKILG